MQATWEYALPQGTLPFPALSGHAVAVVNDLFLRAYIFGEHGLLWISITGANSYQLEWYVLTCVYRGGPAGVGPH